MPAALAMLEQLQQSGLTICERLPSQIIAVETEEIERAGNRLVLEAAAVQSGLHRHCRSPQIEHNRHFDTAASSTRADGDLSNRRRSSCRGALARLQQVFAADSRRA